MSSISSRNAERDFSRSTIKSLAAKGITFVDATWLAGEDGSFANGETGYGLNIDGCYCIRRFREVLELAA